MIFLGQDLSALASLVCEGLETASPPLNIIRGISAQQSDPRGQY